MSSTDWPVYSLLFFDSRAQPFVKVGVTGPLLSPCPLESSPLDIIIIIIIVIVYYAEAAKPYNTIKHSKNTVKSTEMYKNVIRP